jgi:hypothetical protein
MSCAASTDVVKGGKKRPWLKPGTGPWARISGSVCSATGQKSAGPSVKPKIDDKQIVQVLAAPGAPGLPSNLNQLAKSANIIGHLEHEIFAALWLDNRHQVIASEELFRGIIDWVQPAVRSRYAAIGWLKSASLAAYPGYRRRDSC